jgi:hypothetical protein
MITIHTHQHIAYLNKETETEHSECSHKHHCKLDAELTYINKYYSTMVPNTGPATNILSLFWVVGECFRFGGKANIISQ